MPPDKQPRQPKGRPTGGRFAGKPVPEAPAPPSTTRHLPGIDARPDGTTLASHPDEYTDLAGRGYAETGINPRRLTRDYMMFLGLKGMIDSFPEAEPVLHPTTDELLGRWAFTGGTALVSAHRMGDRFSEDIDIVFIPAEEGTSRSRIKKVHGWFRDAIMAGITADGIPAAATRGGGKDVTVVDVAVGHTPDFLKYDLSHMSAADWGLTTRRAAPLLGRFADESQKQRFPELSGFDVPTIPVRVIAVNKLLALNRLAEEQEFDKLQGRARDVYDLYCAATDQAAAADIRANIETLAADLAAGGVGTLTPESRPHGGFCQAEVLTLGTQANTRLREGYENELPNLVLASAHLPDFETALAAIRSLDPV